VLALLHRGLREDLARHRVCRLALGQDSFKSLLGLGTVFLFTCLDGQDVQEALLLLIHHEVVVVLLALVLLLSYFSLDFFNLLD